MIPVVSKVTPVPVLPVNSSTVIIPGAGFGTSMLINNVVTFSGGVTGAVTSASATALTVTSINGLHVGSLTASVRVDGFSSGAAVPVATIAPLVTVSTANSSAGSSVLTIEGQGFSSVAAANVVTFVGGAKGTVAFATPNTLIVTGITGLVAGELQASIKVNGVSSGTPVQVATVTPVVKAVTSSLGASASTLVIHGFGFSSTPDNNSVTLSASNTFTITSATATTLTLTFAPGNVLPLGSLTAIVTSNLSGNSESSASAVVATVAPVVTVSKAAIGLGATTLVIDGFGFDATTLAGDSVVFNGGVKGTVTSALSTSLTVTFASPSGLKLGALTALVWIDGYSSLAAVEVATVTATGSEP